MWHIKLKGISSIPGYTEKFYPRIKLVTLGWVKGSNTITFLREDVDRMCSSTCIISWGKSWWGHYTDCCSTLCEVILPCGDITQGVDTLLYVSGVQWLSGRVLDLRPKTRDQARGRLGRNSCPRGRNFALNGTQGEVGVSLKKFKKKFFFFFFFFFF